MGLSLSHVLLVLVVCLVVFGAGKLPRVMADLAKGLRAFKEGLWEDSNPSSHSVSSVELPEGARREES